MEYNDLFVLIISQQILFQNLIANFSVGVPVASSFVMLLCVLTIIYILMWYFSSMTLIARCLLVYLFIDGDGHLASYILQCT